MIAELERWRQAADRHDAEAAFYALLGNPDHVTKRQGASTVSAAVQTRQVTVKNGDTLQSLARRHGSTPYDLCALNGLTSWPFVDSSTTEQTAGVAVRGQTIIVPAAQGDPRPTEAVSAASQAARAFGSDIALAVQSDGWSEDAATARNDLRWVSGIDAVRQSIRTRLKRTQGWNLDHPLDGCPPFAGEVQDDLSLRMFKAKLIQSVLQDPRIAAVDACGLSFTENVISITLSVRTVSGQSAAVEEAIPR